MIRGDQVSDDAKTEKRLVSQDVVGGRGGVPPNDQSAGNIDQTEGAVTTMDRYTAPATRAALSVGCMCSLSLFSY